MKSNVKKSVKSIKSYLPSGHPHIITKEEGKITHSIGLTSSPKRGHHKNIKLSKNPNPNSEKDSYLHDYLTEDYSKNYRQNKKYENWSISKEDEEKIKIISKKKPQSRIKKR